MAEARSKTHAAPIKAPAVSAVARTARAAPAPVAALAVGNQALSRWAALNPVPGAPPIGPRDHPDEQHADRLADASLHRTALQRPLQPLISAAPEQRTVQSLGPGRPLPESVRHSMQRGFATDLGAVRVHTGPQASRLAGALGARAFAVGPHVAFGARQFAPETRVGARLLAHELAHVVAHPEPRVRADRVANAQLESPPGPELRTAVLNGYQDVLNDADRSEFRTHFLDEVRQFADVWYPGANAAALNRRAGTVVDHSLGTVHDEVQDAFTLLRALAALDAQAGDDELSAINGGSLGLSLAFTALSDDAALTIWSEINATITSPPGVEVILGQIQLATTSADRRYAFEIEATLLALLDAREASNQNPGAQAASGARIAMLSRRLLLLDMALKAVRGIRPDQPDQLQQALNEAAGRIATMRTQSREEASALVALGDEPAQLAPSQVAEPYIASGAAARYYQDLTQARTVDPEEAFPVTVDTTTAHMVGSMASAVTSANQQASRLREGVIPAAPTYTLVEFVDVYRRWHAFFSPEEEKQNPLFHLIMGFFSRETGLDVARPDLHGEQRRSALEHTRSPYELLGISFAGRPYETASFSIARYFAISTFAPMLSGAMGSASEQFSSEIGNLRTERDPLQLQGSASRAYLSPRLASRLPDGRTVRDPQEAAAAWTGLTAQRFSEVARIPAQGPSATRLNLQRLYGPVRVAAMAQPDAPLIGLHDTNAREGWSYLLETRNPYDPDFPVVAREHRVVPPEVVQYLTAAYGARAMSAGPMQPTARAPDGSYVPIGDRPTRSGGLTQAQAQATQNLLGHDALEPGERARFQRDRRTLADAVASRPPDPTVQMLHDMEQYLDAYFVHRSGTEWRLAAVLAIASAEHDLGRQVSDAISPEHLGKVAVFTVGVQVATRLLDARGPLGRILSKGLHTWLQGQGTGEIASIVGVASFLIEVSKIRTFREARAWGYIAPTIFADLSNLVDSVVSRGVGAATERVLDRIQNGPPPTPRGMAATAAEIARDPAARQRMLEAVDEELSQVGRSGRHDSDEYRALEAFRHELVQAGQREPIAPLDPETARALDRPAPGLEDEGVATRDIDFARPRPAAEMQTLRDAVPAELRGRVRVIEDPLLSVGVPAGQRTTVRVIAGDTEVQIHIGRDVTRADIEAHIPAARDMARFTGIGGRVRTMMGRLRERLLPGAAPVYGTRGWEAPREIEKLSRMIDDLRERQAWLERQEAAIESGAVLTDTQRAEIDLQIASLERQIAYHARDIGSMEAGHGFIAAENRETSIRQTVEAALQSGGTRRDQAAARAQQFVRDARSHRTLDAVEDLANSGLLSRLISSGAPPETILAQLRVEGGYAALVRADLDPASAGTVFDDPQVGRRMQERRTTQAAADVAASATTAASSVAGQWPVDPTTGVYDRNRLPDGWTEQSIEAAARRSTPPPDSAPRLVYRRWRYVQSRPRPLPLREWAPLGYQANLNRDVSSPYERMALGAVNAAPNNDPAVTGGRREYDYEEWTRDGDFEASRRERGRGQRGETLRYETTRPDGIRPREDGGFDVVEHKHVTRSEAVLNDSIQFRAQREMARVLGRGRHEIVITSDLPPLAGGLPPVTPSAPLSRASDLTYVDIASGRATHRWNRRANRWEPVQ